jgi:hypothetical protein
MVSTMPTTVSAVTRRPPPRTAARPVAAHGRRCRAGAAITSGRFRRRGFTGPASPRPSRRPIAIPGSPLARHRRGPRAGGSGWWRYRVRDSRIARISAISATSSAVRGRSSVIWLPVRARRR